MRFYYLFILLFIFILSCKYNVSSPTDTLENYEDTIKREKLLVKSDADVKTIESYMIRNKNIFGTYIIAITGDITNVESTFNNVKEVLNDSKYANEQIELDLSKTTLDAIPQNAFKGIKTLSSLVLNDVITIIGESAFENCPSLSYIRFSKDLIEIKQNAFKDCKSIKSLYLFGSLSIIGQNSFSGLSEMESLVLPEHLTSIEEGAFANNPKLKNVQYFGKEPDDLKDSTQIFKSGTTPQFLYLPDAKEDPEDKEKWKNFLGVTWKGIYYSQYIKD